MTRWFSGVSSGTALSDGSAKQNIYNLQIKIRKYCTKSKYHKTLNLSKGFHQVMQKQHYYFYV